MRARRFPIAIEITDNQSYPHEHWIVAFHDEPFEWRIETTYEFSLLPANWLFLGIPG